MTGENLKPEIAELFRTYRESHREIFQDEIQRFIEGANHTQEELAEVRKACVHRAKALRAPTGSRRGRPSGSKNRQLSPASAPQRNKTGRPRAEENTVDGFWDDWAKHGLFCTVCMTLGDLSANRPIYLQQILLFIQDANKSELARIRKVVAKQANIKRPRRGRPDVRHNEEIMGRARVVAWRRIIKGQSDSEIAQVLKMPVIKSIRSASGLIEIPGNIESIKRQIERLEDCLAAAIWNAIPPSHVRISETGREIAPGALDDKLLQTYIGHNTGLPFREYPEECKCIVQTLWPRGFAADWKLSERRLTYWQKKQTS